MRIVAYAAVPLVVAGGITAVRAWDPGGEAETASPSAAFAAHSTPEPATTSASPAPSGHGTAEAASDGVAPRPSPRPAKTGASESPKPAKKPGGGKDAKKGDGGGSADEKPAGEKPGAEDVLRPADESAGGAGHPAIIRLGGDAGPGAAGLLAPDGEAAASDDPGATEPGKAVEGHSKHTDGQALGYFLWRWGAKDAAVKRMTDIRTLGGYLRIYTTLPDTAVNSRHAIKLCERGREYLKKERGIADPIVFVHAKKGLNGHPVLANDLGSRDKDCRLTTPRPR